MYMQTKDGVAVGLPIPRPYQVDIVRDAKVFTVDCAHWPDAELAEIAGILPIVNGYDPARHIASGGGMVVDGGVLAAYTDRPLADIQAALMASLKAECSRRILEAWPDYKQRSAALGVYGPEAAAVCAKAIADHIAACDAAETAIRACRNLAELDKVPAPVWPE